MSSCHTRIACHGKAASPVVGRAVYAFIPEVSFSCPLILLRWQVWLTCKASSSNPKKKKKKKSFYAPCFYPTADCSLCSGLTNEGSFPGPTSLMTIICHVKLSSLDTGCLEGHNLSYPPGVHAAACVYEICK